MMHASLGFIGRAHTVDSDELPQDDNSSSFYKVPTVNSDDHKTLMSLLNDKTISLHYFQHSFLRSNFSKKSFHCNHNFVIEYNVSKIVKINVKLQGLELFNCILLKLGEFFDLISEITRLIINEHLNLKLARSDLSRDSRLECLRGFCENLRICFNNVWSLCSFVKSNPTIRLHFSKFRVYLERYMSVYQLLTTTIIQLSQEFVSNGLLVLSHSDLLKYTHDDLWEISRGIEEYNIIIEHTLFQKRVRLVRDFYLETCRINVNLNSISRQIDQQLSNIRIMSFSKILYKLASERSLLIAHSVHNYFYNSPNIIQEIQIFVRAPEHKVRRKLSQFEERLFNFEQCLSTMQQIGSPVNDYLRLEYEFTSNFLDIISQSTEMLKELSNELPKRKLRKEDTVDNFMAPLIHGSSGNDSTVTSGKCSLLSVTKVCQRRKGVQWSDHTDVSLRHQVIGRYLSVVWKLVNDLLLNSKYSNRYRSIIEPCKGLGSWLLLSENCRKIIGILIERIAKPDIFPTGFIPILMHQAGLIEYENLLLLWDQGMCNSIFLNSDRPSSNQIRADDVSEISEMIYRYLESQSKQFRVDSSKVANNNVLEITHREEVNLTATLLSVGLSTLLKYGEKLSTLTNEVVKGRPQSFRDIVGLLWPIIFEWALIETHLTGVITEPSYKSCSEDEDQTVVDKQLGSILLIQRIPNLALDDTINKMKLELAEAYRSLCCDRVNVLLDLKLMNQALSIDTLNGASSSPLPSEYARGAILGVLEPIFRSIPLDRDAAMSHALSMTVDVLCTSWKDKIEFLSSKVDISANGQLQADVRLIREWINSKETVPESMRAALIDLKSLTDLENRVRRPSTELSNEPRQSSEIGLKIAHGCVRLSEEICSKSTNSADPVSAEGQSTRTSVLSHPFQNLLTKSGQSYFRTNKSDK